MYYIFNNEKLRQNVLLLLRIVQNHNANSEIKQGVRKRALFTLITSVCIELGFRPALRVFTVWNVFHQSRYVGE